MRPLEAVRNLGCWDISIVRFDPQTLALHHASPMCAAPQSFELTLPDGLHPGLEAVLRAAVVAAFGPEHADVDPLVQAAKNPKFGDCQANLAMSLAKKVGKNPREVATAIMAELVTGPDQIIASAEIAGPGFINLTITPTALAAVVRAALADEKLGVAPTVPTQKVVVDYSSPNLAKEMHIGHLRSTIIGDAIVRVLDFLGHDVVRHNHIGDWGTQFGMLLEHLIDTGWQAEGDHSISDLNTLYQDAKKRDDAEPDFAKRARERVVKLQAGDAESRAIWSALIEESVRHMNEVFATLGVLLTDDDLKPESFYNDRLDQTCADLQAAGIATESQGALVGFVEGHEHPLIIRKSDGGYGYGTTDLAAARYRANDLGGDRLVYVVDSRQRDHFQKFIALARKAGWAEASVPMEHVMFGTILGLDGKPFASRNPDGKAVKLSEVLGQAVTRAEAVIRAKQVERGVELPGDEIDNIARVIGISAVKYADLSNDRIKDYVFDMDRMLSFEGNTFPYLANAYVRIQSIFRKAGEDSSVFNSSNIVVEHPAERALALRLAQYGDTVHAVGRTLEPHRLCGYLFELATEFHRFFEQCPVLKDGVEPEVRKARLALCAAVARTLKAGLGLMGLETIERM